MSHYCRLSASEGLEGFSKGHRQRTFESYNRIVRTDKADPKNSAKCEFDAVRKKENRCLYLNVCLMSVCVQCNVCCVCICV